MSNWPLLSGNSWTSDVRLPGRALEPRAPYFLAVSPGFFAAIGMILLDGREFRSEDAPPLRKADRPLPGVGIVNEAFARTYFDGQNPVGRWVDVSQGKDVSAPMGIVGYVRDAAYRNLREPVRPTVYQPIDARGHGTFVVRTAGDPLSWAPVLRRRFFGPRSEFRFAQIQPYRNFLRWHSLRERLLGALSSFFALVALVLAAIGLYGVLSYTVTGRRREIGIRMALGARSWHVVRRVASVPVAMVCLGLALGSAGGVAIGRVVEALLFEVKATDVDVLSMPALILFGAGVLAALPPAIRAVRIDPAETLRSE